MLSHRCPPPPQPTHALRSPRRHPFSLLYLEHHGSLLHSRARPHLERYHWAAMSRTWRRLSLITIISLPRANATVFQGWFVFVSENWRRFHCKNQPQFAIRVQKLTSSLCPEMHTVHPKICRHLHQKLTHVRVQNWTRLRVQKVTQLSRTNSGAAFVSRI